MSLYSIPSLSCTKKKTLGTENIIESKLIMMIVLENQI